MHYLYYHEALHLIEMNRLELKWNSVIVSVEQAYYLLLNTTHPESSGIGISEYVVYSQLRRNGFNIQLHSNDVGHGSLSADNNCIWKCLGKLLQPKSCDEDMPPSFTDTLNTMNQIADRIKLQIPTETDNDGSDNELSDWSAKAVPIKRKAKSLTAKNSKKMKLKHETDEYKPHRYLNILLRDVEKEFENIFDQLDVVELMSITSEDSDDECETTKVNFTFDIYDTNAVYKKSMPGDGPKYRVVVIR